MAGGCSGDRKRNSEAPDHCAHSRRVALLQPSKGSALTMQPALEWRQNARRQQANKTSSVKKETEQRFLRARVQSFISNGVWFLTCSERVVDLIGLSRTDTLCIIMMHTIMQF